MKQILLMIAVVALVGGCASTPTNPNWVSDPNDPNNVKIEKAIRNYRLAKKPTGELTKADYEKVTDLSINNHNLSNVTGLENLTQLKILYLVNNKLTDVRGLENLTQLTHLVLYNNPDLTKAQIAGLQKALPNCDILSNPKK